MSLPSRERGLKFESLGYTNYWQDVAPLAGAWIEIIIESFSAFIGSVAPLAGAWIEIKLTV